MSRKNWVVFAGIATVAVALWARRDYMAWLALGPGGLPSTPRGWLRMTSLRLQARNPFDVTGLRGTTGRGHDRAVLVDLPMRSGQRPRVSPHPVPHRQLTDHASPMLKAALLQTFEDCVASDPASLDYALSHFEKNNRAVTLRRELCFHADAHAARGEIGHIHPTDGSMHMILSPSDASCVIERGWGELHGCAGRALDLPATYTLVYAPRDPTELAIVRSILDAAKNYIAGQAPLKSESCDGDQARPEMNNSAAASTIASASRR
jgi:hypothetical protein